MQSNSMQTNWAEENLQTIRTLMERSAMYRRALAPIVIFAGVMGVLAAGVGLIFHLDSPLEFGGLWLGTAVIVVTGAFFNTRRQAIKGGETVWSPPTRRVVQAVLPPLVSGMFYTFLFIGTDNLIILTFMWCLFYGCALHSAGFFMRRGVKVFGWIFIGMASLVLFFLYLALSHSHNIEIARACPHWLMGFFFGVLHLVYGAYLYLTEKGKNPA
jgi:hypothetical protein